MDIADVELVEVASRERADDLVEALVGVWRASVDATHGFLAAGEADKIAKYVPQVILGIERLVVARASGPDGESLVGFMGAQDGCLEMLFLAPEVRGCGFGASMLNYGIERLGVRELTVNEENPAALGFYEHMGFAIYARSEKDGQGAEHPILRMRLRR